MACCMRAWAVMIHINSEALREFRSVAVHFEHVAQGQASADTALGIGARWLAGN
jgi:hypothetical protein